MSIEISLILLAGGEGSRFGSPLPKQFLPVRDKPLACYSLDIFLRIVEIKEIIIVCAHAYKELFSTYSSLLFAEGGNRRQDSVFNGLQKATYPWVMIHDAARPWVCAKSIESLLQATKTCMAATLGVPIKATLKKGKKDFVVKNIPRESLFEIQTPQIVKKELLIEGFARAHAENITVTDDVSLIELLRKKVKIVPGSSLNIKVTTPDDLTLVKPLLI